MVNYCGVIVLMACICLSQNTPIVKRSSQQAVTPKFLLDLYNKLASKEITLQQLNATQVRGVWVTVQTRTNAVGSANVVDLISVLNRSNSSLKEPFLINLHLTVQAPATVQQGDCKLVIVDVTSGVQITSKDIPCASSTNLIIPVTSYIKNYVTSPASNDEIKLNCTITSKSPLVSSLPFVSASPNVEPPFYIIYE